MVISPAGLAFLRPSAWAGRPVAWPLFLLPGAAVVSGVSGGPQGDAPAPLRPEGGLYP
jgi:hypothetical protein